MKFAPGKPQLLCRSIEQAGNFGFDIAQARLSCVVVSVAAATENGGRPARVLASRRIESSPDSLLPGSTPPTSQLDWLNSQPGRLGAP